MNIDFKKLFTLAPQEIAGVVAEFFATFLLVFMFALFTLQINFNDYSQQPLNQMFSIFGPFLLAAVVAFLTVAFGKYQLPHLNPAVSLGLFIKGEEKFFSFILKVVVQVIAALLAFALIKAIFSGELFSFPQYADVATNLENLKLPTLTLAFVEGLGGFLWTFAALKVKEGNLSNQSGAFLIALSVTLGLFLALPFSLGVVNPLFAIGLQFPAVYMFAPLLGAVVAVLVKLLIDGASKGFNLKALQSNKK